MIALNGDFRWTLLSSFGEYMCNFMRHIRPKMAQRQTRLWINTLVSSKLDCFKHSPEHFSSFAGWFAVKFITFELTLDIYVEFKRTLSSKSAPQSHVTECNHVTALKPDSGVQIWWPDWWHVARRQWAAVAQSTPQVLNTLWSSGCLALAAVNTCPAPCDRSSVGAGIVSS